MNKKQKPLRSIRDEIFDADMPWDDRGKLAKAYRKFFEGCDKRTRMQLAVCLMF